MGIRRVSDFNVDLSAPGATGAKTGAEDRFWGSNEGSRVIMIWSSSSRLLSMPVGLSESWIVSSAEFDLAVVSKFLRCILLRFFFFFSAKDEGPSSLSVGTCVTTMVVGLQV